MKSLYFLSILLLGVVATSQAQELLASAKNEFQPEVITEKPIEKTVSGKPSKALKPTVASESSFYVRVYGAYALAISGAYNSIDFYSGSTPFLYGGFTTTGTTIKDNKTGLGQGLRFGGGIGYILNDFINLGLDVDYYKSGAFTNTSVTNGVNTTTGSLDATMLTFVPNITFKAISADNYYIYNRLGINVGLPKVKEVFTTTSPVTTQTYEFQGGMALGYLVGIGIQFRLQTLSVRLLKSMPIQFLFSPDKRVLVGYIENGVDKLASPPASVVKQIDYFDNLTSGAGKSVTLTMPFNSLGAQVGLAYRF